MFVDQAKIYVKAGDGGKGCESYTRDKFMKYPKPDGGDGGRGGDIGFIADTRLRTLLDFKYRQHYKAPKGGHGSSSNKKGKEGQDCILKVPLGTIIKDAQTGLVIKDLVSDQQTVIVAKGGSGGRGNANKKVPTPPGQGEELVIRLELKLIADVGIVGFPNAGKSTLISALSKVKSKIARYPFTTKQPILGIVSLDDYDCTLADLPGLIEGAHKGKGLGDRFLRHAERTKVLLHVIDMGAEEGRDPIEDYNKINNELEQYGDSLGGKERIVVANKMDLPQAAEHLERFKKKFPEEILEVSALEKTGLTQIVEKIRKKLCPENSQNR